MLHSTHNEFHLGDNLVHLNFLRRMAIEHPGHEFQHAVQECHLGQLRPVVKDLPNVRLIRLEDRAPDSRNVWKNVGAGESGGGYWERHPQRNDFVKFHLDWFAWLGGQMGLASPIRTAEDLLFNYPTLDESGGHYLEYDVLVVNSQPCSGQLLAYDCVDYLNPLIAELAAKYRVVVTQETDIPRTTCTTRMGMDLTDIGALSLHCRHLIMVATGPMWTTFNTAQIGTERTRLILIGTEERIDLLPGIAYARDLARAKQVLVERGIL